MPSMCRVNSCVANSEKCRSRARGNQSVSGIRMHTSSNGLVANSQLYAIPHLCLASLARIKSAFEINNMRRGGVTLVTRKTLSCYESWRRTTEIFGTNSVLFKGAETSGSSRKRHQRKGL